MLISIVSCACLHVVTFSTPDLSNAEILNETAETILLDDDAEAQTTAPASPAAMPQMRNWQRLTFIVNAYANFSPDNRTIVYQSNAAGNWDLYLMDADGNNARRLVDHSAADITPVFSPDGSRIAFVSERDGNREVYVVNADGSTIARITRDPGHDIHPVWSPDSSRLMFSSNRGNANDADYDIYIMNADGTNLKQITDGPEIDTYSSWSPDETMIVTRRVIDEGRNNEVFVMNADGSNQRNLTNNPSHYDGWPVWSPDGKRIAFASGDLSQQGHFIYLINPDGTGLTQITAPPAGSSYCYNTQPSFSHDGKRLAYTMYRPGPRENAEICVIDIPT